VVAEEPHPPYARPPLSKALWKGDEESTIWRGTADLGVELRLGRTIVALDLEARRATDDQDETYTYKRLLLATGGRPRRLPFGGDEVIYFRTIDDYRRLRALAEEGARFLVIGGGFIGSEIAAALAMNARSVTMVFPEPGIGARIFPAELSESLTDYYRARDVEVLTGASVTAIERNGDKVRMATGDGRTLEADAVVAGLGIEPRVELATGAGLPVADGILVDDRGHVDGHEKVFAAGDVARFPEAALGGTRRVEHEDHAKSHGRLVGANMAGADLPYDHLPSFYSDLFDLGYEAVGELDSRLQTTSDLSELSEESTIYYLDGQGRPRGVLLWNLFGSVEAARDRIRVGDPVDPRALLERSA
jgi:3-phenylpropionate/trans-cinnamate dioxygenase ferredoxin reductase component